MRTAAKSGDWADPGYFTHRSPVLNAGRVLKQMVIRPRGHKTMLTRTGMMLCLLAIAVGTAAFNTSSNILYLTLALLLSCLLLSGLLSWMNFKGTKWRLLLEPHFRAEEVTPVRVEMWNEKPRLPTYSMAFQLWAKGAEEGTRLPLEGRLDPGQRQVLEWLFLPRKRGVETVVLAGLQSKFPFGFLRKTIADSTEREVLVWPARISYQFKPTGHSRPLRGERPRKMRGQGAELVNLREYRRGDPLRQVHWKASARLQKLLIRETAEENQDAFVIHLRTDASEWAPGARFEKLCAFATSLAEDLYMQGQLAGVAINDEPFHPTPRLADLHAFFGRVAGLEPSEGGSAPASPAFATQITFTPGTGETVAAMINGQPAGMA